MCIRYLGRNKQQRGRGQRGRRRKFYDRKKRRENSPSEESNIKSKENDQSTIESTFKGDPLSMLAGGGDSNNSDGEYFPTFTLLQINNSKPLLTYSISHVDEADKNDLHTVSHPDANAAKSIHMSGGLSSLMASYNS